MPDDAAQATATVVKDGKTVTITFVKDASLGFVLQYDDHYTFDPGFTGATFTTSDANVATVDSKTGEVVIKRVSANPVTITATAGSQTKTLTITKTIRAVLSIWMLTGQSNSAINYYDTKTTIVPKEGTAMYFGWRFGSIPNLLTNFISMTTDSGTANNVASMDAPLADTLYKKTGEKILFLNAGISGTGIGHFLPGNTTAVTGDAGTWGHIQQVYQNAYKLWTADSFQTNYETRLRSFFFLQGCAEVGSLWTTHYNGFAVNKNTNAFTTNGVTYGVGTHTFYTYMTEVLGFDNCFDIPVAWRPVGMTTSTRTAQFKLAEELENYHIVTTVNQTLSYEEGTYRFDNLHYSQAGKNIIGQSAAAKAVAIYQNSKCLEKAEKAVAYLDKTGYEDGSTIYVQAGDYYNYATRLYPYTSDDTVSYKFVGDDIVESMGLADISFKSTAPAGSTCKMEIYSYADNSKPLTTVTFCVVGDKSSAFTSTNNKVYSWTFDSNKNATTTSGNIQLSDAGFNNGCKVLSEDITLDADKYWSIEWQATDTKTMSMLATSSGATATNKGSDFMWIYYRSDIGWNVYRNKFTDNFWKTYSGSNIIGTHTYKIECSNRVYVLSIDGKVVEAKPLVEGHGCYAAGSNYSDVSGSVTSGTTGYGNFSPTWNMHYLLGGVNTGGESGTKYAYNGDVSYVKVTLGDGKSNISAINRFPYTADSGNGTAASPYVINANVAKGTVITPASFAVSAPLGTVALSAESFGGKGLESLTCNTDSTVYVMTVGSIASNSTFFKVNFRVSDTPDSFPDNMPEDTNIAVVDNGSEAVDAKTGAALQRTIHGKTYNFVKGYNLFTSLNEAVALLDEDATVYLMAGTYAENLTVDKSLNILGPKAGIDPNTKGATEKDSWTLSAGRSNESEEAKLTGEITIGDSCGALTIDGVTITKSGKFVNGRTADNKDFEVTLNNVIVTEISTSDALTFGEAKTAQTGAITGKLTVNNLRAYNNANRLINTALGNETFNNCYFEGSGQVLYYRVPGVVDDADDHTAAFTMNGCFFDGANKNNSIIFGIAPYYSKSIGKYKNVALTMIGNVYKDCISSSAAAGFYQLYADTNVFTLTMTDNLIYESSDSVSTAASRFVYGLGYVTTAFDKDYSASYVFSKNRFVSAEKPLPLVFGTITTNKKSHNNVNISGNYFEVAGAVADATVDSTNTANTNNKVVSYSEYKYLDAELTKVDCAHTSTSTIHETATCQKPGYDGVICNTCGILVSGTETPKIDHIPGSWVTVKEATCTTDGKQEQRCTVCSDVLKEQTIAKLGHDNGTWSTTVPATCTSVGVETKACTRCHTVLETRSLPKLNHKYEGKVTKEPTCSAEGVMTYTCELCGDSYTEAIAKTSHTLSDWITVKDATCEVNGEAKIVCTVCGETVETKIIPAGGHIADTWKTEKTATCTKDGKEVQKCKVCGEVINERTIPAKGHTPGAWKIVVKATTNKEGLRQKTCTVCGAVVASESIPKLTTDITQIYEDIGLKDWYVKNGALDFAVSNGLLKGLDATHLAPKAPMTRAMFVTVLGRLEGIKADHKVYTDFTDVGFDKWYTGYVAWAAENDIVNGISETAFAPDQNITREQICKIMVKYCEVKGIRLNTAGKAVTFKDAGKISGWAKGYVATCQKAGLVSGDDLGNFNPKSNASRAEVATILMNFANSYINK